jgi:quercetin dioxygenase-like cupin family protein
MIVRSHDAKKHRFKGIDLDILAHGEKSMITRLNYKAGDVVPLHQHPHEQCGYIVAGRVRLAIGEQEEALEAGDSYCIPGDVPHGMQAMEDGSLVDFFAPAREDYR